jgi:hypothetical protein
MRSKVSLNWTCKLASWALLPMALVSFRKRCRFKNQRGNLICRLKSGSDWLRRVKGVLFESRRAVLSSWTILGCSSVSRSCQQLPLVSTRANLRAIFHLGCPCVRRTLQQLVDSRSYTFRLPTFLPSSIHPSPFVLLSFSF